MKCKYRLITLAGQNYYTIQWKPVGFLSLFCRWKFCDAAHTFEEAKKKIGVHIKWDMGEKDSTIIHAVINPYAK